MTGRRSKRSPERETAILNALRVGNTRRASAAAAGISHELFYQWLADLTFLDAVVKAEADAELRFLGQVATAAKQSWQAAAWWLERRKHEDYRRMDGVELSGPAGGPIQTADASADLSDHERALLRAAIDRELKSREEAPA
jgi:hypothetical protein